jgi:hypothetical protein
MKIRLLGVLLPLAIVLSGCTPVEQAARDAIAASAGALRSAQATYGAQCKVLPSAAPCVVINKAIAAQGVAIDATEAYCGFTAATPAGTACAPVKTALPALQTALANLSQTTKDVQGLLK